MADDDPFKSAKVSTERHVAGRRSVLGLGATSKRRDEKSKTAADIEASVTDKWTKKDTKVLAAGGAVAFGTNILTGDPSTSLLANLLRKNRAADPKVDQAPPEVRDESAIQGPTALKRGPIRSTSPAAKDLFEQAENFNRQSGGGLLCDAAQAMINREIIGLSRAPLPPQARHRELAVKDFSGVSFTTWPPVIFGPSGVRVKYVHLRNMLPKLCDQMLALPLPPVVDDHGRRFGLLMDVTKFHPIKREYIPIPGEALTFAEFWRLILAPDRMKVPAWERNKRDLDRAIPLDEIRRRWEAK